MSLAKADISKIWGKGKLKALFAPVDNATIILFRMMFGGIMFWEVTRYFKYDWITKYWIAPKFNFSYTPFNFQPLEGDGMIIIWYILGVLALCIFLGLFYRVSISLFFLIFTYTFLLDQARYLNHFYLICLISFFMIFIPASRAFSLDSLFFKKKRSNVNAAWNLWLIRFLIGLPYFFGGIAKINPDWLRGYPMHLWLGRQIDFPIIGKFFTDEWMIQLMSFSGLLLDLAIVPLLLFKRTRIWGFIIIISFHLLNSELFIIGIFPWFMIAATTLFFAPDWPKTLITKLSSGNINLPILTKDEIKNNFPYHKKTIIALAICSGILVITPFRHILIKANVHWTEEGDRYAWRMKLIEKYGNAILLVKNKQNGQVSQIKNGDYLADWQISAMGGNPILIWKFTQIVKNDFKLKGEDVQIFVVAKASLNGREFEPIIDPNIDFSNAEMKVFGHDNWILPSTIPLKNQR
jgi:hypothetical protein